MTLHYSACAQERMGIRHEVYRGKVSCSKVLAASASAPIPLGFLRPKPGAMCVNVPRSWTRGGHSPSFCRGPRGCRGAPSNDALPCTRGKRTRIGVRLGPCVGSWRDPHPHFHLHLISCSVILSSHIAMAGPVLSHESSHPVFVCHSFGLAYLAQNFIS